MLRKDAKIKFFSLLASCLSIINFFLSLTLQNPLFTRGPVFLRFCSDTSMPSFSDSSLRLLHKNYLSKDILKTVEIAKKIDNIHIGHGFFLNPPGSSTRTILEMIWFLLKTKWALGKKMGKVFMINRIRIEPHTKMHQIAIKEGLIKPGSNLLRPVYYTQRRTYLIECLYNAIVFPLNILIKIRRLVRKKRKLLFINSIINSR